MDDRSIKKLIKTVERNIEPPADLKVKMLKEILLDKQVDIIPQQSIFEKFIFEKPLRAACLLSVIISGTLWAALGNEYPNILLSFIGKR